MAPLRAAAGLVVTVTVLAGCGESPLATRSEIAAAEGAIAAWVADHPSGWSAVSKSDAVPTRPSWIPSCDDPLSGGRVSLRLETGRGDLELAFRCPVDEHATAEVLQERFLRAVPWNLPTGISSPNWRFQASLPANAIEDGVTFHTPRAGVLEIDIRSEMTGIRAENTRRGCVSAMDATRSECTITREHRVPLHMRFLVTADLSALR